MPTSKPYLIPTSKPARLATLLLLLAAGCGGGGTSAIGINGPAAATIVDAGQTVTLTTAVVNDSGHAGATFAVTGGGGTLGTPVLTALASSSSITTPYTAPAPVAASTTATITATSVHTPSQSASVTLTLNPALAAPATLPAGTVAVTYSASAATTGGTGASTYAIASGTLPAGLPLSVTSGLISGKPTTAGSYTFAVAATDKATLPVTLTTTYTIVINPAPLVLTPQTLPSAVAGTAYSQQLAFTGGGTGTPVYTLASGSLPAGVTLSASGLISGTPANAAAGATYNFSATVTVGTQTSTAQAYTITVAALPAITTTSLPAGNIGLAYSQQLSYTGGSGGTATFAVSSGTLPAGLSLSASGLLSGTPTTAATSNFAVTVTVGTQTSVPQAFTLVVNSLIVTSAASATGEVSLPFSFQLTARGGTAPYTWSLATGSAALPAGLSLNTATGLISGSPTIAATTTITVQAKDAAAATASQSVAITINPARTGVNNALLTGQYAFLLTGFDTAGRPAATAGKFTADGLGNITGGILDTNGTAGNAQSAVVILPGTYSVGADNRGKITLATSAASTTYTFALDSVTGTVASSGTMIEFDGSGASRTGVLALQTTLTAATSGNFALGLEGFAAGSTATTQTHRAAIGQLAVNASAELLLSASSTAAPTTATTTTLSPAVNGRATLTLALPNVAGTLNFAVYPVSATRFLLLSLDHDLLSGQALAQTGTFSNASLSATAVFHTQKLTGNLPDLQLGLYSFNGAGSVTQSSDENAAGVVTTNSFGGTYTVAANGRTMLTLAPAGLGGCTNCTSLQTYFYLAAPNQGFVMDFSAGALSGGFDPQTATTLATGPYSVGDSLPLSATAAQVSGVATVTSTAFTGTIDQAAIFTLSPDVPFTATITPAASGRITTGQAIGYVVSPTRIQFLDRSTTPLLQTFQRQ